MKNYNDEEHHTGSGFSILDFGLRPGGDVPTPRRDLGPPWPPARGSYALESATCGIIVTFIESPNLMKIQRYAVQTVWAGDLGLNEGSFFRF